MNKAQAWVEVIVPCATEAMEAVENFLFEQGSCGLEEHDHFIRGYFDADIVERTVASSLESFLKSLKSMGISVGNPVYKVVPFEDWSVQWRQYFKPVRVTSRIVIKPPWESSAETEDEIIVDIMPRMAFGTGTHETTQLCMELIENYLNPSDTVMDVGTGSGILAIVTAKMGASSILALDIAWEAVQNARENISRNGVEKKVSVICGSIETIRPRIFDLILANINRGQLESLLPMLKQYTHPGSLLILSGILLNENTQMESVLKVSGCRVIEKRQKGEWLGYVVQPGPSS